MCGLLYRKRKKAVSYTHQDVYKRQVMMLTIILMAFAEDGYASLRKLEKLCRYDIRYRSITNGCVPSYKSFERFINHTLKESIQTIAKEIYLSLIHISYCTF